MDNNPKETELEEGEISDLEDGEIEDDETPENLSKLPLISEPPQQALQGSDFPPFENTKTGNFRGGKFSYFNPQRPKPPPWRRDAGPPPRLIEEESRFREQESPRMRTRPSFAPHHNVNSPRQGNLPWKKNIPRISPNLPNPLIPPIHGRPKPFPQQKRHRSPSPEADNTNDFDLLLERHKQIQLQLDRLEKEESAAMLEEDFIDDSFVDIPVDTDTNNIKGDKMAENIEQGDDGEENDCEEDGKPKSFEPFKIKPLHPPIPTIKELSNRQQAKNVDENLIESLGSVQIDSETKNNDANQESQIISPKGDTLESSQTNVQVAPKNIRMKMKRRRRRKRAKEMRKANIANKGINVNNTSKDFSVDVARTIEQNTVGSRLMQLAATSAMNPAEKEKMMRISAEKQQKRRERLKWWQQSRKQDPKSDSRSGKGRGANSEKFASPGERTMSDGKDFEKDDYLEAPMDVESDTPDGPVLPLIEETGDDAPPPPPPPPAREQELMALMQQQQQMAYNTYSVQNMLNQVHVSPNIHGFYPPGQFIHSDWPGSYTSSSMNRDSAKEIPAASGHEGGLPPSLQKQNKEGQVTTAVAENEEEDDDDDEAALLREILLKSVAKKRAAKSTDLKEMKSQSAPASPRPGTSIAGSPKPSVSDHKTAITSHVNQKSVQQPNTIKKIPIQPPQHDPVVIRLGEDSDSSDEETYQQESGIQQRGGFFGSLDMMLKQARNSVENSKPKSESKSKVTEMMAVVPKTPDALSHLPEERRAEYRRLKEQLAQHEGKKNRQPLSDISQDKESKSESETPEEKMDSAEESRELLELKEKVKMHEEKLAKHRKSLSEDQEMLGKMTSMLSEKTILLEVQETRVNKLKKQLEIAQKAMLNNRLVIKKLHEKAIKVKDRVAKKMTVTRNIEEDLLRVKSMVSAVRKDPSFYTGSDSNENKETVVTVQEPRVGDTRAEGSLKRSLDDSTIMNSKKAKIEPFRSHSAKASPRKNILAERIALEKARLKRLEQNLAERLSHFTRSPSKNQSIETKKLVESDTKQKKEPVESPTRPKKDENTSEAAKEAAQNVVPAVVDDSSAPMEMEVPKTNRKENDRMEFNIDDKQLDYIKKLQDEKVKKGPTFPKSVHEMAQSVHKRTASCIWLDSDNTTLPVLDVDPAHLDWFGSSSKSRETGDTEEEETEVHKSVSVGSYESILLYFRSYRLSPYFRTKAGLSLSSLTFTNKLNPFKSLCDYELKGVCNDEDCKHQHCRDYTPTDTDAVRDLASYAIQASEKLFQSVIEKRINLIVEKFIKQYKGKIPMDQLLVLLVNSIKKDRKSTPFNIRGSAWPASLGPNQQRTDNEESTTSDRGRGVQFGRKEERKMKSADEQRIECQEVRYFSEIYNSIKTLTEAVEETPSDITLWIKLSRLQLHQTSDDNHSSSEGQDMGLMQCLNTLSRGLEANPNSEELWLEYLKLFRLQGHPDEHKELCEQAIGFTPTYNIWWHYLDSANTYDSKRTICIRLLNHLAKQEQQQIDELHSHRLLESLLYLVQLELYTGRHKLALLAFQFAIGKKKPTSNDESSIPKITTKISAQDFCLAWLAYIHVLEFHRLPVTWFDPKFGHPTRMVAKETFVFPWQPGGGTSTPSEKILGMFHEALRACTLRNKATPNKIAVCLPLYQNLLALERAHGRLDSAKGICRRLLQGTPGQVELWQCLAALEETTGNPKQGLVVLNEGLEKCGHDWELAYTAARLHLEQGEASKAIEMLVYTIKSRYWDPSSTEESPRSLAVADSSTADPILLYRKLLSQPLPYDSKPPPLMGGVEQKPTGRDELYLWLSYCLLLELSPSISPLCLQYNLSAESAYETAVHTVINRNNAKAIWLEYLLYKTSRVSPLSVSSKCDSLKPLDDLVNRCLVSVSASRTLPYSTSESWLDYSFHNQVINLYLGCLPQSLWSAIYTKYLKLYPSNLQLAIRACEHEASTGCVDQAVKIASIFLSEHPSSITMWKILISLNLQRNHIKEAHKLYQQSTDVLPFAATLWKDFIMFELVRNGGKSSVEEIIQKCKNIGLEVEEYLKTLQGSK